MSVSGRRTRPTDRPRLSQYSATCSVRGTCARCTFSARNATAAARIFVRRTPSVPRRRPLAARWVGRTAGKNTHKHHQHHCRQHLITRRAPTRRESKRYRTRTHPRHLLRFDNSSCCSGRSAHGSRWTVLYLARYNLFIARIVQQLTHEAQHSTESAASAVDARLREGTQERIGKKAF